MKIILNITPNVKCYNYNLPFRYHLSNRSDMSNIIRKLSIIILEISSKRSTFQSMLFTIQNLSLRWLHNMHRQPTRPLAYLLRQYRHDTKPTRGKKHTWNVRFVADCISVGNLWFWVTPFSFLELFSLLNGLRDWSEREKLWSNLHSIISLNSVRSVNRESELKDRPTIGLELKVIREIVWIISEELETSNFDIRFNSVRSTE